MAARIERLGARPARLLNDRAAGQAGGRAAAIGVGVKPMMSETNPAAPRRRGGQRCPSTPITPEGVDPFGFGRRHVWVCDGLLHSKGRGFPWGR